MKILNNPYSVKKAYLYFILYRSIKRCMIFNSHIIFFFSNLNNKPQKEVNSRNKGSNPLKIKANIKLISAKIGGKKWMNKLKER